MHPILEGRDQLGEKVLVTELRDDEERFYKYFQMMVSQFNYLHSLIEHHIKKQDTNFRESIRSEDKLAAVLR